MNVLLRLMELILASISIQFVVTWLLELIIDPVVVGALTEVYPA